MSKAFWSVTAFVFLLFSAAATADAQFSGGRHVQPLSDPAVVVDVAQAATSTEQAPPGVRFRERRPSESGEQRTTAAPPPVPSAMVPPAPSAAPPAPLRRVVFRLRHAPAVDVAKTINEVLSGERKLSQPQQPGAYATGSTAPAQPVPQAAVVPEPISNSLIVSGSAGAVEEIAGLVRQLDQRPRMVTIEVLIAETLEREGDDADAEAKPSAAKPEAGKPAIEGLSPQSRFTVAELQKLGVGEAAASEVRSRLRALEKSGRLEILARPQLTTLDNHPGYIQIGKRVPRITGATRTAGGQINNITLENVGLLVKLTPRISPDGLVTMAIDLEKSELSPFGEGADVAVFAEGGPVRSPQIDILLAQATVSVQDGQSLVLGGLITRSKSQRRDLLVVLTPPVLR